MAVEEKKPMVVMPNEIIKAGKLDGTKRVVGRIVEVEEKEVNYTCYLICGTNRREALQIDAWQEQKGPARRELTANRLVSITNATLVLRKGDKQKYSLSACRFAIRFDKNLAIASAENEKADKIAGGGTLALKDLPMHFPVTSLKVAACLKEATVVARISVIDAFHKENTSQPEHEFRKVIVEDTDEQKNVYRADIIALGDLALQITGLEIGKAYMISNLLAQPPTSKYGFALRWLKSTRAEEVTGHFATQLKQARPMAVPHLLSMRPGTERTAFGDKPALLVSASTVAQLIFNSSGPRKFSPDDIWELPWVSILDIPLNSENSWHYDGCKQCLKKQCDHHAERRCCYVAELSVADHTAAIDMKVFTAGMDVMLTAIGYNPLEPISDHQKALDAIRGKNWSMRCVIVEDAAYQSKAARNSLQVVSVKERFSSFVGTPRPLFAMQAENLRPGIIPVHVRDTHVDAAEQVLDKHDRVIELAEMMIRCSDETPQEHANDHEKGVRITIVGEDPVAESGHKVTLMWVGTLKEVMPVIRMQPQTLLRVIAQPHVKGESVAHWQVVFYANADPTDLDSWCKRKAWQESSFEHEGNKRKAAEMSLHTPLTKVKQVRETLTSPSHSTSAHT